MSLKHHDVAFVCGIFPDAYKQEILNCSKGMIQAAADVLQKNIIQGLDENLGKPVKLINAVFIGSFPLRYKKLFVKNFHFSHIEGANDVNVGFCNLMALKRLFRRWNVNREVKKWAKDGNSDEKLLFAYAMTDTSTQALKCAKKQNHKIKTVLIVPDLPQYMNLSTKKSWIYDFLKNQDWKKIKKAMKYVDEFVLLTEEMANFLEINNYTVMEGISSGDVFKEIAMEKTNKKTIVYAGTLNLRYGVGDLVDAFRQIKDPDYQLIICGNGNAEPMIKQAAKEDDRICFKGVLERKEVLKILTSATLLVNPRKNNEEYTKYSFPSKILEYLSSGTPVVAYKLDGIPDEYDDYVYYVEDNSTEALANKLMEVCSKPSAELEDFGKRAKDFVLQYKNAKTQIFNVLTSLEGL